MKIDMKIETFLFMELILAKTDVRFILSNRQIKDCILL